MGIKEDSGKILKYLYDQYVTENSVDANNLIEETSWDGKRIDRSLKYLKDINAIKITLFFGNVSGLQNFNFDKMTPDGISIIEDEASFKHTFGINLGIFSWSTTQQ